MVASTPASVVHVTLSLNARDWDSVVRALYCNTPVDCIAVLLEQFQSRVEPLSHMPFRDRVPHAVPHAQNSAQIKYTRALHLFTRGRYFPRGLIIIMFLAKSHGLRTAADRRSSTSFCFASMVVSLVMLGGVGTFGPQRGTANRGGRAGLGRLGGGLVWRRGWRG